MKLYTKGGDKGETGLFGGQRVSKASLRVSAYGDIDELNSAIGVARSYEPWPELDAALLTIQNELFDLGSNLATPKSSASYDKIPKVQQHSIDRLESWIDAADAACPDLTNFILPGGSRLAAWLLYLRTICRRAERLVVALRDAESVEELAIQYLNRLSDLFFAWGREANTRAGVPEVQWQPNQESE